MDQTVEVKVRQYFSKFPKRQYPKGQILIFADEDPDYIFYLTKGKVIKYDVAYNGDEVIVNIFKPSSFFPMSWAINHGQNHFFYKTETESEMHVIPASDALSFMESNTDVMMDLIERIYRGTEGLLTRMVQLMVGSAKNRILLEVLIEARRFGEKNKDGSTSISINEQELASRAGMSRETVSREINKMKSSKLVKVDKGNITVLDLDRVEAELKP